MHKLMKLFFSILIINLFYSYDVFSEVKFSDYRDYIITKKIIQLQEISKGLNHPWGMTFIDEENLLVTEKNGKLFKINVLSGKKIEVNHNLNILHYGQGGLLDVYYYNRFVGCIGRSVQTFCA